MKGKIFLVLFLLVSSSFASEKLTLNIALYALDKKSASEITVKKMLLNLFKNIDKLKNAEVNTYFYKNKKKLLKDYKSKNKKFDLLYMVSHLYIENYEFLHKYSDEFISLKLSDNKYQKYYLVTNKSSNIKTIFDIDNKKLSTQNADRLSVAWLDHIFYKKRKSSYLNHIKSEITDLKAYKALLDVYFNKMDLAIVTDDTWDTTVSLNASLKKKLHIIETSPKIFPSVIGVFHQSVDPEIIKAYNDYILEESNQEYIEDILNLVKVKGVEALKKEDFKDAYDFYNTYLKEKAKYN